MVCKKPCRQKNKTNHNIMDKEVHIVSLFLMLQTPDIKSLDQLLLIQPDKKEMILSNMKEALLTLIDK